MKKIFGRWRIDFDKIARLSKAHLEKVDFSTHAGSFKGLEVSSKPKCFNYLWMKPADKDSLDISITVKDKYNTDTMSSQIVYKYPMMYGISPGLIESDNLIPIPLSTTEFDRYLHVTKEFSYLYIAIPESSDNIDFDLIINDKFVSKELAGKRDIYLQSNTYVSYNIYKSIDSFNEDIHVKIQKNIF